MQKISIELVAPGMKIAKPVINKRGMALCNEGTELTEELISRLSNMGIEQITVKGSPIKTGKPEKSLSQQIDELNDRFIHVKENPIMEKIKNLLIKHLKERAEEE